MLFRGRGRRRRQRVTQNDLYAWARFRAGLDLGRNAHNLPLAGQQELPRQDLYRRARRAAHSEEEFSTGVGEDHLSADTNRGTLDGISLLVANGAPDHVARHPPADLLWLRPAERAHVKEGASRGGVVDRAVGLDIGPHAGRVLPELEPRGQVQRTPERIERLEGLVDDLVVGPELADAGSRD